MEQSTLGLAFGGSMFCKGLLTSIATAALVLCAQAESKTARPAILGISHITVYATDVQATKDFYVSRIGLAEDKTATKGNRYFVNAKQYVEVEPLPAAQGISRLEATWFQTSDAEALRRYLMAHQVAVPKQVSREPDGRIQFEVHDPEGNIIGFEQTGTGPVPPKSVSPTSNRIIHIGFAVHNRSAEDSFYQTVLGFRPYWHGGMKDSGPDDWVSLQVPDGTDWLEYMLSGPSTPTQRSLGVLNHFSLGVTDINDAAQKLEKHGWQESQKEHRQEGRDGKRQLNLYDPDLTRVEYMEFKPFTTPCCSAFTGQHPTE